MGGFVISVGRFAIAKDEVEAPGGKFLDRPSDPQGEISGQEAVTPAARRLGSPYSSIVFAVMCDVGADSALQWERARECSSIMVAMSWVICPSDRRTMSATPCVMRSSAPCSLFSAVLWPERPRSLSFPPQLLATTLRCPDAGGSAGPAHVPMNFWRATSVVCGRAGWLELWIGTGWMCSVSGSSRGSVSSAPLSLCRRGVFGVCCGR